MNNVRQLLAAGLVAGLGCAGMARAQVAADEVAVPRTPPAVDARDLVHLRLEGGSAEFLPRGTTILYTSKNQTANRYNPGAAGGTIPADPTRVAFDDVPVPASRLGGASTINVCKVVVGIRRVAPAVATTVTAFWATATSGAIAPDTVLDSPGTAVGAPVSLPAAAATATTEVTWGATNGPTLFTVPLNMGLETNATGNPATLGTFMLGVRLGSPDISNGWRLTVPAATATPVSDANADVFWQYDPNLTGQVNPEAAYFFGAPPAPKATFYIEITGTPVPATTPAACCLTSATGNTACFVADGAAHCTQSGGTLGGGASCSPNPCNAPANDLCAGAQTLTLDGVPAAGQNTNATVKALPGCGFSLVDGPAVFYKFTGNGNNVTISTCNTGTLLDTVLHVYCAPNGCAGPFNCVGGNDDANPACVGIPNASTLTVPTISGDQYFVVVNGFQGAVGSFLISALDTAVASTITTTCAARTRCVVDTDPFDFAETDACGAGAGLDTNNSCATATAYPTLGMVGKGSISTAGAFRDVDFYLLPGTSAGTTVTVSLQSETPAVVLFQNDASGTCTGALTNVPNSNFVIGACAGINTILFQVALPATGNNYFIITTPSFNGDPCGIAPNSQNDYRVRIAHAATGACCGAGLACTTQTVLDCATAGGTTWFQDLTCSLGTGGIDPCTVTPGHCCTAAGACQLVPSSTTITGADCTAAGGTFTADPNSTCTPNPCAAAGICCRGATCSTDAAVNTAATCAGSLIAGQMAGSAFPTAAACNSGAISTAPCCYANYNHDASITAQDIFDFLNDWFAGSPYANTGGTGAAGSLLSAQNIFDFLTDWFNGGCN